MDLREHWEKIDSPTQKSITALAELIGSSVTILLEPTILWGELRKHYPDQANFIPGITSVVKVWADVLTARLSDDDNEEWTEQLLDRLNQEGRGLNARVEAKSGTQVTTSISKSDSTIIIGIPQAPPPYRNASAYFVTDFTNLFAKSSTTGQEDDDWASVAMPSRTPGAQNATAGAAMLTELPSLDSLPRPEILFATQTPYHMILKVTHDSLLVYGSHQGHV